MDKSLIYLINYTIWFNAAIARLAQIGLTFKWFAFWFVQDIHWILIFTIIDSIPHYCQWPCSKAGLRLHLIVGDLAAHWRCLYKVELNTIVMCLNLGKTAVNIRIVMGFVLNWQDVKDQTVFAKGIPYIYTWMGLFFINKGELTLFGLQDWNQYPMCCTDVAVSQRSKHRAKSGISLETHTDLAGRTIHIILEIEFLI